MTKPIAPLELDGADEYRLHFIETYCRRPIELWTANGPIPVYFRADQFDHAFFESSKRDGVKDEFSPARATRMPLIHEALTSGDSARFAGWITKEKRHDHTRCVAVVTEDSFVVVIRLGLKRDGSLRANFVTCFHADNSMGKIAKAPEWDEELCRTSLRRNRNGR